MRNSGSCRAARRSATRASELTRGIGRSVPHRIDPSDACARGRLRHNRRSRLTGQAPGRTEPRAAQPDRTEQPLTAFVLDIGFNAQARLANLAHGGLLCRLRIRCAVVATRQTVSLPNCQKGCGGDDGR
jgi:hypothetical protein